MPTNVINVYFCVLFRILSRVIWYLKLFLCMHDQKSMSTFFSQYDKSRFHIQFHQQRGYQNKEKRKMKTLCTTLHYVNLIIVCKYSCLSLLQYKLYSKQSTLIDSRQKKHFFSLFFVQNILYTIFYHLQTSLQKKTIEN